MLRNREFLWVALGMVLLLMIGTLLLIWTSLSPLLLFLFVNGLFFATFVIFTRWRYGQISELSRFLHKISSGNYALDVRDNFEGELSILKANIYKVTSRLAEHSALLKQEQIQLTEAISDISHQLKTPLTSMHVMADLLSNPELPPVKRTEFTKNIQLQLERMDWLVTSLLKLSKIDAGTAVFKKEKVYVFELIHQALKPLLILIDIKNIHVQIEGDESLYFQGDLNWSVEALSNVLKNCVEHTPQDKHIFIHFYENALFTEITIKDEGKGIPKIDLPNLFKRFYRGQHAGEDSVGIGLALSQSIITQQNGDIEIASEPGKGTTFIIKFYKQRP